MGENESEDQQHVTQKGDIHQNSYLPVEDYIPNQTKSQFVISIYYVRASNIHQINLLKIKGTYLKKGDKISI